ncbi:ANTAR domain-containing protein [Kineococcus sp. TRM81007]|uniref:ANTAR domain-containing protein n=1 Tax=Kineococcus sp. TRM81007 TaxID=2925831 RepID=UPI001F57B76D|nr:ANTAR domain-containing protein [Kineococcus sp. TRM81007]MCI2238716.1 ANTAR domain-containing protein [Kineococcus sp. TRM81007]
MAQPHEQPTHGAAGGFTLDVAGDLWRFCPAAREVLHLPPEEDVTTTARLCEHVEPRDALRLRDEVGAAAREGVPFGVLVSFDDGRGGRRWATVTGGPVEPGGPVRALAGQVADVTGPLLRDVSEVTAVHLRTALESRQVIDQAKGALMLVYGIGADEAFELLRWSSQHRNVKLAALAERVTALCRAGADLPATVRGRLDDVLQTTFAREAGDTEPAGDAPAGAEEAGGPQPGVVASRTSAGGTPVVRIGGDVDLASAAAFSAAVVDAVEHARAPRPVVVDLSGVGYLGSVGVSVLTGAHRRCERAGTPLRVVVGARTDVLDFPGLRRLSLHADLTSALAPGGAAPGAPGDAPEGASGGVDLRERAAVRGRR